MSELTPNLKLFKYDTLIDGKIPFSIDDALNQNWDILDSKIGTLPYVKKSGDTMTGNLMIEKNSCADIYLDNTTADYTSTTTPSSNLNIGRIMMRDKNNAYTGVFQSLLNTGGNMCTEMVCRRSIDGTNKAGTIAVRIGNTGTIHTYAPACSTANSIVTTTAISKSANGYLHLGNGVKFCWGTFSVNGRTNYTITFPKAFSTTAYVGMQTVGANINDYNNSNTIISWTASNFVMCPGYGETRTIKYLAVGY